MRIEMCDHCGKAIKPSKKPVYFEIFVTKCKNRLKPDTMKMMKYVEVETLGTTDLCLCKECGEKFLWGVR